MGGIQVKAGAGWRGEEDGADPASPYLKRKKKKLEKKFNNLNSKTKLKIKGSFIVMNPVF